MDVTFNAELVLKNSGKNVEFCQKMWLIDIYSMSRKYNSLPKSQSKVRVSASVFFSGLNPETFGFENYEPEKID